MCCLCVCVSCLCRPPSHWWIRLHILHNHRSWPWGWATGYLNFKSNHNKKFNRQNAKQYMWDCTINLWNRKQCSASEYTRHWYPAEQCTKSCACTACKTLSRMNSLQTPEFGDSLTSVAHAHSNVFWLNSPNSLAYTAMQLASSNFRSWARIYKLSKFVLRGY